MAVYKYTPRSGAQITLEGVVIPPTGVQFTTDNAALNSYVPSQLLRYVDGVYSEPTPFYTVTPLLGALDINGKVIGFVKNDKTVQRLDKAVEFSYSTPTPSIVLPDGTEIVLGSQTLSLQSSSSLAVTSEHIGINLVYTGTSTGTWTITGGASIGENFGCYIENNAPDFSLLKITPSSGTINGRTSISIPSGAGINIYGDGSSELKASFVLGKEGRLTLAKLRVPMILPSSGTIGANGALTLTTALHISYTSGCYMYFPAGACFSGSAAGFYYVIMSSTTLGTVYNNMYTTGIPNVISAPVAIVDAGPGAYTQTTGGQRTFLSITLPGGILGNYGGVEIDQIHSVSNSANVKTIFSRLMPATFYSNTPTTTATIRSKCGFDNIGSQSAQIQRHTDFGGGTGQSSSIIAQYAIDTSVDQTLTLVGQLANATDFIVLNTAVIEIVR